MLSGGTDLRKRRWNQAPVRTPRISLPTTSKAIPIIRADTAPPSLSPAPRPAGGNPASGRVFQEALAPHPVVAVEGAEIPRPRIRKDGDDARRAAEPRRERPHAPQRRAARSPREDRLLARQLARRQEGVAVGHLEHVVDERELRNADDLLVAEPLEERLFRRDLAPRLEVVVEDGPDGVHGDDADARILLLEVARDAADRPSRPHPGDHVIDPALHLPPDLGARRAVMSLAVLAVVVLVREVGARRLGDDGERLLVVALGVLGGKIAVDQDQVDAHRAQAVELLLARLAPDDHLAAQVLEDGHHG